MSAVVTVDMQNAFFSSGSLQPHRQALVARCNELHRWARSMNVPVALVRTEHRRDRSTWTLNMLEDDTGFLIAGDPDTRTVEDLDVVGTTEVVKTRDSAFHETGLDQLLRKAGVDRLVLAGVSTHTCIAATAADAYAHDLHVVFAEDAIASHREDLHEPTLSVLCTEYRFRRRSTRDIVTPESHEPSNPDS